MDFEYDGGGLLEAYERLIYDALIGDKTLFARADGIERLWEVVQPVLDAPVAGDPVRGRHAGARPSRTSSSHRAAGTCRRSTEEPRSGHTVRPVRAVDYPRELQPPMSPRRWALSTGIRTAFLALVVAAIAVLVFLLIASSSTAPPPV